MDMPDSAVIKEIREGNIDTFEILVEKYSAKVRWTKAKELPPNEQRMKLKITQPPFYT